jgi:hypothetical protein
LRANPVRGVRVSCSTLAAVQAGVLGADPSIVRDLRPILAHQDAAARAALGTR